MKFGRVSKEAVLVLGLAVSLALPILAHAQTTAENQLRATITSEVMSDPRSKQMTQAQIYSLVNALMTQAQEQGITSTALTYRPQAPAASEGPTFGSTLTSCSDVSCSLSHAFGLDGSIPIIPIGLFVAAVLFILIYSIMREMGHPHAQA